MLLASRLPRFARAGGVVVAPTLAAITPFRGKGYGGTLVTLTGSGFTGATGVTFDGVPATDLTVVDDTELTCKTPSHVHGDVDVEVTTPGGSDALVAGYKFLTVSGIRGALPLLRHYGRNYDPMTGTWVDESGNFDAVVPVGTTPAATIPSAVTIIAGQQPAVSFNGSTDALLAGDTNDMLFTTDAGWFGGVVRVDGPGADAPYDHIFGVGVYAGYSALLGYDWGEGDALVSCFADGLTADYAKGNGPTDDGVERSVQSWRYEAGASPDAGKCRLVVNGTTQTVEGYSAALGTTSGWWAIGAVAYGAILTRGSDCVCAELFAIDGRPSVGQLDEMNAYLEDCIT